VPQEQLRRCCGALPEKPLEPLFQFLAMNGALDPRGDTSIAVGERSGRHDDAHVERREIVASGANPNGKADLIRLHEFRNVAAGLAAIERRTDENDAA